MKYCIIFQLLIVSLLPQVYCTVNTDSTHLEIPYSSDEIIVDGDLSDWDVYLENSFSDTLKFIHSPGSLSMDDTFAKGIDSVMLHSISQNSIVVFLSWDLVYLCVALDVRDSHLNAEIMSGNDNPNIFLNDDIEIYIDTKNDSQDKMDINDYQFMVDIVGNTTIFRGDRRLMNVDTISIPKDYGQNILCSCSTKTFGTINDNSDIDAGFIVEMKIPLIAIGMIPETGSELRLDICISDQDYSLASYKKLDGKIQLSWPFNWSGYSDFGYPSSWRTAVFTGEPGWLEKASLKMRKQWITGFVVILSVTYVILAVMFYYMRRRRNIPDSSSVESVKVLFVNSVDETMDGLSLNMQKLESATKFITDNLSSKLTSENVARGIKLSLRKFQQITKEEINCTPTQFIYIVKLNIAKRYLQKNELNISEIAYDLGFSSPSYFSKLFKSHFGISPAEYTSE